MPAEDDVIQDAAHIAQDRAAPDPGLRALAALMVFVFFPIAWLGVGVKAAGIVTIALMVLFWGLLAGR